MEHIAKRELLTTQVDRKTSKAFMVETSYLSIYQPVTCLPKNK